MQRFSMGVNKMDSVRPSEEGQWTFWTKNVEHGAGKRGGKGQDHK